MRRHHPDPDAPESLAERLLAALIAAPLFELALLLACWGAGGKRGGLRLFLALPPWLHLAVGSLALSVGVFFGFAGLSWLLGHLFMTHFGDERDWRITAALWGLIGLLAWVVAVAGGG